MSALRSAPASILLTGASSGIGWALARELAAPGVVLGLVARRRERLEALRAELERRGARALVLPADVREAAAMGEVVGQFLAEAGGADLVIANAGISRSDHLDEGDPATMDDVIAVNVQGAINTLAPVIPHMIERRSGHLVAIASVASYRGLPSKGAYCASKAALRTMMDAWRPTLRRHGIRVTTISPGWVESEMTASARYAMPFILGAEPAARLIARAIERGKANYVLPWQMRLALPLIRVVPDWMLPFNT